MKSFSVSVSDETQTDINKELTVWGKTESVPIPSFMTLSAVKAKQGSNT